MRNCAFRLVWLAVAALSLPLQGMGQEVIRRAEPVQSVVRAAEPVATPAAASQAQRVVDTNKRLSVGDVVSVEIEEDREAPISRVITATGDLEVPPLDRVRVVGKTTAEAAALIKTKLEADYYYKATVKIAIDRVNVAAAMGKIQIQGEVRAPGVLEYPLDAPITVNEAILKAGGFMDFADGKKVQVTRVNRDGRTQNFVVNVKAIQRNGEVDKDMRLQDGDRVFIPKAFIRY